MNETVHTVKETSTRSDAGYAESPADDHGQTTEHKQNVAENVVWFVTGILLVLLGFRFLLSLLGANTTNAFANFVYDVSHPFVAPFFNLFHYNNLQYGVSRFEVYTLFAMLVYAVIAWGIVKLITLNRD